MRKFFSLLTKRKCRYVFRKADYSLQFAFAAFMGMVQMKNVPLSIPLTYISIQPLNNYVFFGVFLNNQMIYFYILCSAFYPSVCTYFPWKPYFLDLINNQWCCTKSFSIGFMSLYL